MEPTAWGPPAWNFLHGLVAEQTSDQACGAQRRILQVLRELLPCTKCRVNYVEHTRSLPQCAENQLAHFVSNLHNQVNAKLNKPVFPADFYPPVKQDDAFVENMFYFLFVLAHMYPKHFAFGTRHAKNMQTLLEQIPLALPHHSPVVRCMASHPLKHTTFGNRKSLMSWLYQMYNQCTLGPKPSLSEIKDTMKLLELMDAEPETDSQPQ